MFQRSTEYSARPMPLVMSPAWHTKPFTILWKQLPCMRVGPMTFICAHHAHLQHWQQHEQHAIRGIALQKNKGMRPWP